MTLDFNTITCESCIYYQQELQKQEQENTLNFITLKQKIISTDLIIKKYHAKCQEVDCLKQKIIALSKQIDQLQRDVLHNEIEIRKTLQDNEQLQKRHSKLETLQKEVENHNQSLQEKLVAAKHSEDQYKAALQDAENAKDEEYRKRMELQRKFQLQCIGKNENKESQKHQIEELQKETKNLKNKVTIFKKFIDIFSKKLVKHGLIAKNGNRILKKYFGRNGSFDSELQLFFEIGDSQKLINSVLESIGCDSDADLTDKDAEKLEQLLIEVSEADGQINNKKEAAVSSKMAAKQNINFSSVSDNKVEATNKFSDNSSSVLKNDQDKTLNHHSRSGSSHNFESVLSKIRRFTLDVDSVLSPLPPSPYQNDEESDADDFLLNSEEKEIENIPKDHYTDESIFESDLLVHHQVQHQLSEGFSVDMEAYEAENVVNDDNESLEPVASNSPKKSTNDFRKLKRLKKIDDDIKTEMPVITDATSFRNTVLIKTEHQGTNMFASDETYNSKPIVKASSKEIHCIDILDEHNYSATDNDLNNNIENECLALLQTLISKICETREAIDCRVIAEPCSLKLLISGNVGKDSNVATEKLSAPAALGEILKETESRAKTYPDPVVTETVEETKDNAQVNDSVSEEAKLSNDLNTKEAKLSNDLNIKEAKLSNDINIKEAKLSNDLNTKETTLAEKKNEKGTIIENDHNKNKERFIVTPDKFIQSSASSEATVLPSEKHSTTSLEVLQNIQFTPTKVHRNSEKPCSENEVCTPSDSSSFSPPLIIKPLSPLKSPSEQNLIILPKAELTLQSSEKKTTNQSDLTVISVSPPSVVKNLVNDDSRNSQGLNNSVSFSVGNINKVVDVKNTAFKRQTSFKKAPINVPENNKTSCSTNKEVNNSSEVNLSSSKEIINSKDLITQPSFKINKKPARKSYGTTNGNTTNNAKRCLGNDLLNVAKHFKPDVSRNDTKSSDKVNIDIPGNQGMHDILQLNSDVSKTSIDDPSRKDLLSNTQNAELSLQSNENVDKEPDNNVPSLDVLVEFNKIQQSVTKPQKPVLKMKKLSSTEEEVSSPMKAQISISFNLNSKERKKDSSTVLNKDIEIPLVNLPSIMPTNNNDLLQSVSCARDDKNIQLIKNSKRDKSGICQTGKKLKTKKKAIITTINLVNTMKVDASVEDWNNIIDSLCDCTCSQLSNFLARRMINQLKTIETDLLKDILTAACNNQFPPLTDTEQKYLYVASSAINKYQLNNLFIDFISIINEVIFKTVEDIKIFAKATLCRFYTALCRLQGNLEIARIFCYDLFRSYKSDTGIYIASVIGVWPSVVNMPPGVACSLCHTFQFLLLKKSSVIKLSEIHHLIKSVCQTSVPSYDTEKFTTILLEKLTGKIEDTNAKEIFRSLELIAAIEGWEWTNNILIRQKLWPLLQKWSVDSTQRSKRDSGISKNVANSHDKITSLILKLIGTLCQLCPRNEKDAVLGTVKTLTTLLSTAEKTEVPWCIQQAAVEALLHLEPYDHNLIKEALMKWRGKNFLSPEILELVENLISN